MRGGDERSGSLFSYVDLEARIDQNHPLRVIRMIVNEALAALAGDFSALYSRMGRPSIAPEKLLRAMLLQAFYSIRSEREKRLASIHLNTLLCQSPPHQSKPFSDATMDPLEQPRKIYA